MIGSRTCAKTENTTIFSQGNGRRRPPVRLAGRWAGSPRQRRTALAVARGFFVRVGQLQGTEVVPVSADDLSSHGQPFRREAAGYRGGGQTGNGHVVARLHPVYVGLHPFPVDLGYAALLHVEGWDLAHRRDEELIGLHEGPHPVEELRPLAFRPSYLRSAQARPLLDVPYYGILQRVPAILEQLTVGELIAPRPECCEDLVRVRDVRLCILHRTTQRLEDAALVLQHRAHARVHRQAAEVPAPGDPHAAEVAFEGAQEETTRLEDGERAASIRPRYRAQHEGRVFDRAGHGTVHREREPRGGVRPAGHPPW